MDFSRREFGKLAASLPMAQVLETTFATAAKVSFVDSAFGGVKVGIIAPYAFRGTARDVDQILKGITDLGLSHVEMQAEPVEAFAGAPARRRGPRGPRGGGRLGGAAERPFTAGDQGYQTTWCQSRPGAPRTCR